MNDPWQAEIALTDLQAADLIREQFPELNPLTLQSFGSGWDNVAWLVNEEFVFRFPRRTIAVECMQNEIRVLPRIADRLSLSIPNPIFLGKPTESFPWPFAGYRVIPGETACQFDLNPQQRESLVEPIAKFLKVLHAIPAEEFSNWNVQHDSLGRYQIEKRITKAQAKLSQLNEKKQLQDEQPFQDMLRETADYFQEKMESEIDCLTSSKSLVHGDFYLRHLLLDEGCLLTGIIDWGDVHLGYPACDLMFVYSFLTCEQRDRFWNLYGDIGDETKMFARFHALLHTLHVFDYAKTIGDTALIRESQKSLENLAE